MLRYQMIYNSLESYRSRNKVKPLIVNEIWALEIFLVLNMQKFSFDLIFIWCHIDYTNAHRDYEKDDFNAATVILLFDNMMTRKKGI